jgi:hypothetical protein
MKKIIAALIISSFGAVAFAQAPAITASSKAPSTAPVTAKVATTKTKAVKKVKVAKAHAKKSATAPVAQSTATIK